MSVKTYILKFPRKAGQGHQDRRPSRGLRAKRAEVYPS